MKKIITVILLVTTLFSCMTVFPAATPYDETSVTSISLRANNEQDCNVSFTINSSGLATVYVDYAGKPGYFSQVVITIKIQKKLLGLIWTTVDNGQPNNEWYYTSGILIQTVSRSLQLESTGTYRAVVEARFNGTGGAEDVIQQMPEAVYN